MTHLMVQSKIIYSIHMVNIIISKNVVNILEIGLMGYNKVMAL